MSTDERESLRYASQVSSDFSASAAILLAAGRSTRMRGSVADKILVPLGPRRRPVFLHSVAAFVAAGIAGRFVVVYRDAEQRAKLGRLWDRGPAREWPVTWVRGGRERQESVARALALLTRRKDVELVFIHDAARPLVRADVLRKLADIVCRDDAACLAHPVSDTIKRLPANAKDRRKRRLTTLDRRHLWAMETPQAFRLKLIADAYAAVRRRDLRVTDDAAALELCGRKGVTLVENPYANPKITHPADLAYAEFLLGRPPVSV